jgi:hypothetical protein
LLAGDDCPNCGDDLMKPSAGKVQCARCHYVVNGQRNGVVGDFNVTKREAARLLDALGYDAHGSFGTLENRLRRVCDDHGTDPAKLSDVLKDITGRYADSDTKPAGSSGEISK